MHSPRALLLPLVLSLACASSTKATDAPQCDDTEPVITVSNSPTPSTLEVVPHAPELITLRLFVVDPGGAGDADVPEPIRDAAVCKPHGCSLLLAPMLMGRNRSPMELEVGTGRDSNLFAMRAQPFLQDRHVQLQLEADMFVDGEAEHPFAQRFEFSGTLEMGQLTHIGTFHANDRSGHVVGPQVFAMVEHSSPD